MFVRWHEPKSVFAAEMVRWRNFCSVEHHDDMITLLAPVFYMLHIKEKGDHNRTTI